MGLGGLGTQISPFSEALNHRLEKLWCAQPFSPPDRHINPINRFLLVFRLIEVYTDIILLSGIWT